MALYVGIDPGQSGGIAALFADGSVKAAVPMPGSEREICAALRQLAACTDRMVAMLEYVRSSPQMGVASAFKFGAGYGGLRMALVACGVPFEDVHPVKWQRAAGVLVNGRRGIQDASVDKKNLHKKVAQELFPDVKVTHALADALLLADYCRRYYASFAFDAGTKVMPEKLF